MLRFSGRPSGFLTPVTDGEREQQIFDAVIEDAVGDDGPGGHRDYRYQTVTNGASLLQGL
jgi:hypothetical protein